MHIGLAIVLGVLTTVAVAWVCALYAPRGASITTGFSTWLPDPSTGRTIFGSSMRSAGCRMFVGNFQMTDAARTHMRSIFKGDEHTPPLDVPMPPIQPLDPALACAKGESLMYIRAGWPLPALRGRLLLPAGITTTNGISCSRGTLHITHPLSPAWPGVHGAIRGDILPLIPALPGFLTDTALFTAAWAALLIGLPALRRRSRTRRRRCLACNYDMQGHPNSAPCPECGTPHLIQNPHGHTGADAETPSTVNGR